MINGVKDNFLGYYEQGIKIVKQKILGPNNERLDFVMDSFYKLPPNYQGLALLGGIGGIAVVVMIIFEIEYF